MSVVSEIWSERSSILVTCAPKTGSVLAGELQALGFSVSRQKDSAVWTEGTLLDCMRLNLWLRTAHRVHWRVGKFEAATPDEFYRGAARVPWERWIEPSGYVSVSSAVVNPHIRDHRYVNLKCKDALCDRLRVTRGRRPDSGSELRGVSVFVHWHQRRVNVFLDTTGEALSKRGYRVRALTAPMQETLAAAILLTIGWRGETHFINPMCGSGTLAIEAALLATRRAPALTRETFAFQHLREFDANAWERLRTEARQAIRELGPIRIVATDHNESAIVATRENAKRAGVSEAIAYRVCDFSETPLPKGGGVIILNPEYGERMGETQALVRVYRCIGDFFKRCGPSWRGYVFTGNPKLFNKVSLRPDRHWTFFSGGLECRLLEFVIYVGKRASALRRAHLCGLDRERTET